MVKIFFLGLSYLFGVMLSLNASAESIKVLTTGAYKQMILTMIPLFEVQTGHKVSMDNETAGELIKRVKSGEAFDVLILTPQALKGFGDEGVVESKSIVSIAKVGIGIAVKQGQDLPSIKTVDDFEVALTKAKKIAYINPASGGSSGIYLDQLFKSKGWSEMIKPKAFLVNGGYVANALVTGEADLAIHQISEIVPVKGASLVGPLPEELQNYTVYAGAVGSKTPHNKVAKDFLNLLSSPQAAQFMREKGMTPMF